MPSEYIAAGVELGSHTVKCVVGVRNEEGHADIIGTGTAPAKGFQNGIIRNQEEAVASVTQAVKEAGLVAGCVINEAFVSVSGRHLRTFNSDGMTSIQTGTVTKNDVHSVIQMCRTVKLPAGFEVMHVVPQEFLIDHQRGLTDPLGMAGVRLEVHAHVVTGVTENIRSFEQCCKLAGLDIADVVLAPLAQAEVLLDHQAKDLGVVLVDIGGETTDVAVFVGGSIVQSVAIPLGGHHMTMDLKDCLSTPAVEAENLKRKYGNVLPGGMHFETEVEVPGIVGRPSRPIRQAELCEIIEARLEEILRLVDQWLIESGLRERIPGGVVLTGGTANLIGIAEFAERILGLPAVVGQPKQVGGLLDVVRNPRYSTATGLVLWGVRDQKRRCFSSREKARLRPGLWRRFVDLFHTRH